VGKDGSETTSNQNHDETTLTAQNESQQAVKRLKSWLKWLHRVISYGFARASVMF